jgi:hypothetical protein
MSSLHNFSLKVISIIFLNLFLNILINLKFFCFADKELLNEKDRQEIELQAQRLTLQEQRNHIDILDNALMSAQNNVIKLETEVMNDYCFVEH